MSSRLRKEMCYRNNLRNRYYNDRSRESWECYRKQRNKVTSLHRESVKQYFAKCRDDGSGKTFWRTVKPYMTDKNSAYDNIMFKGGDHIVTDRENVSKIFNDYFGSVAESIGVPVV